MHWLYLMTIIAMTKFITALTLCLITTLTFVACNSNTSASESAYEMVKVNYPIASLVDFFPDPIIDPHYIPADVENYNQFLKDSVNICNALDYLYPMLRFKPQETFDYNFDCSKYKFHLGIEKTSDNRLKFYRHDLKLLSTTLIQYKDSCGKVHVDIFNPQYRKGQEVLASFQRRNARSQEDCPEISSGLTCEVNEIKCANGETIYLTIQYSPTGVTREKDVYVSTIGYVVDRPQKLNLFEDGDSIFSTINVYLELYHSDRWKTDDMLFKYYPESKELYVPIIEEGDEFGDRYIVYKFDGNFFRKDDIRSF